MFQLLPLHQELLDLHHHRNYKPCAGGGDDGGGDDNGNGDSKDDHYDEEEDMDLYYTDNTDIPNADDVTPSTPDQVERWNKALLKKRTSRKACKQWDVIRVVFDGLLQCYEQKCWYLRQHHLDTCNKARRNSQALSEFNKEGNMAPEEVNCYIVPCPTYQQPCNHPPNQSIL
jgi:hypothetical protein